MQLDIDPRRDDIASATFWLFMIGNCEDLSIDVSITNVGLILTKLRWIKFFNSSQNTSQNSISTFVEKKFKFLCYYGVVLGKTFPLMYQLLM